MEGMLGRCGGRCSCNKVEFYFGVAGVIVGVRVEE